MTRHLGGPARAAVLAATLVLAGCSSTGADEQAAEKADAKKLVAAAHAAGVAPGLTVEVAESLYGTSAAQICDVLAGGVSSGEALLLSGNPSGRRHKLTTSDAVTFDRLVVQTYCPAELSTYDDLVDDIDPTEKTG